MPFGQLTSTDRLGVANVSQQNATGFATNVLRLANAVPIYQEQLAHNTVNTQGSIVSAEWCGTSDTELGSTRIIRKISAHDTVFGRRNISDSPSLKFNTYIVPYNNQLFYMCNEPEAFSSLSTGASAVVVAAGRRLNG